MRVMVLWLYALNSINLWYFVDKMFGRLKYYAYICNVIQK